MKRIAPLLIAALMLPVAAEASAQTPAPAETPDTPAAIVASVNRALIERYVFPERVTAISAALAQALTAGRYSGIGTTLLIERMSEDLRKASNDRHLYLVHDPARFAALVAQAAAPKDTPVDDSSWRTLATREHHGLSDMRLLPGNIRYLRITGFHWTEDETGAAYDDAIRFLKGGDAIIIDLRGNGGGSHAAVRYLISHFLDGDTPILTFRKRGEPEVVSRALEYLPAGRLKGKPLFTLTDNSSGSAAEEFAYQVQQFGLGVLVGATTAGAANNNDYAPLSNGLLLSISTGSPVHPVSKTNWEAKGVVPDIAVAADTALEVAQQRALAQLIAAPSTDRTRHAEYVWIAETLAARLRPAPVLPAAQLRRHAGVYGEITITQRPDGVWFARADRPTRRLWPMDSNGLFGVEGVDALRVAFTATGLEVRRMDALAPTVWPRTR